MDETADTSIERIARTDTGETPEGVWLDRGPGSGGRSEQADFAVQTSRRPPNDGRSHTRTTFYYDTQTQRETDAGVLKSDGSRRSYTDLAQWNDGRYAPDRAVRNDAAFRRRFAAMACSQLDCTPHQRARVEHVVDEADFGELCVYSYDSETIVLAMISLVVEDDMSVDEAEDVDLTEDWIVHRDDFRELMADVGMDGGKLWDARRRVVESACAPL